MISSKGDKQKVVIVGGGFAGRTARRLLQKDFDVVLLDGKGYFEYTPSILRCLVEPSHAKKVILAHPEGTRTATAVSIDAHNVKLSTGEDVQFDYCLLCTGSAYSAPIKPDPYLPGTVEVRIHEIEQAALRLAAAERIVIVGGGTVGVELAAEVAGKWKTKKHVTLITNHDCLLDRMPKKAQQYAKEWMEKHGVEVLFNERVVQWESPVRTESGREVAADLVYKCVGYSPNSAVVTDEGSLPRPIPVHSTTLQWSGGRENVFVCGDCSAIAEEKTAFAADLSAQVAAKNILHHSQASPLLQYPQDVCQGRTTLPDIACVSLYKRDAILQVNGMVITGTAASMVKHQIEFLQLALAQEHTWAKVVWSAMEISNLWFSRLV